MRVIACLNFSRSSALSIASRDAPIISTPNFSSTPFARQVERAVERRLAAHRRQQRVGPLLLDDARHHLPGDRLDVGGVGHLRVGHDRRRVRIHQHHAVALGAQRLARLRARIVELAGLADDDRPRADDQDALDVSCALASLHHLCEAVEQIADVVRSGTRFRVALKTERRPVGSRQSLQATRRTATRAWSASSDGIEDGSTANPWFSAGDDDLAACPGPSPGGSRRGGRTSSSASSRPRRGPSAGARGRCRTPGCCVASRISPIASMA